MKRFSYWVIFSLILVFISVSCSPNLEEPMEFTSIENLESQYDWEDFEQGIKILDVKAGDGNEIKKGDNITAFYTLFNSKGEMLQSNKGDTPFTIPVGVGSLIRGWDMTVPGMKEGGIRRLIVPGPMAYGDTPPPGSGIGVNETLVFELELAKPE